MLFGDHAFKEYIFIQLIVFCLSDAEFSGSDSEGTFLPRKSATDDLFDVFGGNSRIHRKGSRKGRRSSIKEVEFLVKVAQLVSFLQQIRT